MMRHTLILLTLLPALTCAQSTLFQFNFEEGLTRSHVSVVYEDSRGILWVGTLGAGLYQLSGGRFVQDPEILQHTGYDIIAMDESADGTLYIRSDAGIIRHDGHETEVLPLLSTDMTGMTVCGEQLWYCDSSALYLMTEGQSRRMAEGRFAHLACVSGELRLVTTDGLYRFDDGIQRITQLPPAMWTATDVNGGELLLASDSGKVLHIMEAEVTTYDVPLSRVTSIRHGGLGDIWLGSESGLYVYHSADEILLPIREQRKLSGHINTMLFDMHNRLWIGTRDYGLLQYRGEPVTRSEIAGSSDKHFIKQRGTQRDAIWLSDTTGEIYLYDAINETMRRWRPGLKTEADVQAFFPDRFDRRWFATDGGGLSVQIDTLTIDLGLDVTDTSIAMMSGDPAGRMWIETHSGKLTTYGLAPRPGTQLLTFEGQRVTGDMLTDPVVALLANEKFEMIRVGRHSFGIVADGVCQTLYRTDRSILSAELSTDGVLWMGLNAGGVMKSTLGNSAQPVVLIAPRFLQPYDILFIHKEKNTLWLGTDRSVLRLRLDAGQTGIEEITTVYQAPSPELGPRKFTFTKDGMIIVLTREGLLQIPTASAISTRSAPRAYITAVAVTGQELYRTEYAGVLGGFGMQKNELILPFRDNDIAFSYAGATTEAGALTYQWKLDGVFDNWSAPSVRNTMQFVSLAPGSYSFQVRVCNVLGKCSMLDNAWRFTIRKGLQHQWWFWAALTVLVTMLIVALVRRRIRILKRRARVEQERLRARVAALEMEQKALQLQMNPHFIFNVMQTIQAQMQRNQFARARNSMGKFAHLMRSMLDISRRKEITLEEEVEFLKLYLDLENTCRSEPFTYQLILDRQIETFAIAIPPMLIQPVVENAVKHGTTARDPKIEMEFYDERSHLRCIVRDNGEGIAEQDLTKDRSAALLIIRERLEAMGQGGELRVAQAAGGGAEITLVIPIESRNKHKSNTGKR